MNELQAFDAYHRWVDSTGTGPDGGERITAAEVRQGDTVQHFKRFWPAQTVTAVTERYGRLTFELSGGSRVTGVDPRTAFIRY